MFYSEKYRKAMYTRHGEMQEFGQQYEIDGKPLTCNECGHHEFIRLAYTDDLQCVLCWVLHKKILRNMSVEFVSYGEKIKFPEFNLQYKGTMIALKEQRQFVSENPHTPSYIGVYKKPLRVEFFSRENLSHHSGCAYINAGEKKLDNLKLYNYIKEIWDWDLGVDAGIGDVMNDFLHGDHLPVYKFEKI